MITAQIHFESMVQHHLPLWEKWKQVPHVWFADGYESSDKVHEKIAGNGYDYPFIIYVDAMPVGFIQACDLFSYRSICEKPKGLFINEPEGTWCVDLFIAETEYLDKGYGTQIMRDFTQKLFSEMNVQQIWIDPAESNKRAIRCYEKTGFSFVRTAHDGVTTCHVMRLKR